MDTDGKFLFFGIFLLVIGHIYRNAVLLKEENDLTV
jgi:hypothetical protein